ncbi:Ribosome-binding protein 1, putative [Babesia ovata]|uniref:Ribosome-binding protein 1, putative n=1 Tax=Babesia ovata TaxID=189622 RepID=A0A2H6KDE2_9APIC|nr:Ribosome-binding protein 1, putative [Babesia ovata]GBE61007.1 Ribosome-binding protein 1, putative [Babesia ovata]
MTKHGIPLDTLKECLMFLLALHKDEKMQGLVAEALEKQINAYFKSTVTTARNIQSPFLTVDNIRIELSEFVKKASDFYTRLCKSTEPWTHGKQNAAQLVSALLDCFPKFLSAMYYLWYCIDNTFGTLGGGGWQNDWPGWELDRRDWLGTYWGGDLQRYLRATVGDKKYDSRTGLLPGGFGKNEVRYSSRFWHGGYAQGYKMADDLRELVSKGSFYNFFRSVFVSSVFSLNNGTHKEYTANALSLVRTFCDIVEKETNQESGGALIEKLDEGLNSQVRSHTRKSICWQDLKEHCEKLRTKIRTLFNQEKRFDFIGQSTDLKNLHKEELATRAAHWMRTHLTKVRGNLSQIRTDEGVLGLQQTDLGEYFTKHFFPYGFIFKDQTRFVKLDREVKLLMTDWRTVIDDLKKGTDGDLDRLVQILNGDEKKQCPKDTPDTKAEGTPNQGKKAEGTPNQGKKGEGAQNQGKKGEGTPTPNNGQSEEKPPPPPSGASGGAGPKGPPGPAAPASSSTQDTSGGKSVHPQQPAQLPPVPAPPPPAPTSPAAPTLPGPPGPTGQGSQGSDVSSQVPASSSNAAPPQTPSASGSSPRPTGGRGSDPHGGQDVTQTTSQGTGQSTSSGATPSGAPAPGSGGGGGLPKPQVPSSSQCKPEQVSLYDIDGKHMCYSKPKNDIQTYPYNIWEKVNSVRLQEMLDKKRQKQDAQRGPQIPPNHPPHPSHPAPVPSSRHPVARSRPVKPYYDPGVGRTRQVGGGDHSNLPSLEVDGQPILDARHKQEDRLLAQKRKNELLRLEQKFLHTQQQLASQDKKRMGEIEQRKKEATANWEKKRQEAERRLKKYSDDVGRIQNVLERGKKDAEERQKQEKDAELRKQEEKRMAQLKEAEERRRQEEENERQKLNAFRSQHPIVPVSDAYYHYRNRYPNIPTHTPTGFSPFGEDEMPRLEGFNAIPQAPLDGGDVDYLVGQVVQDNSAIERQDKTLMEIHDAERKIYSDNAEREREFQKLELISKHVDEERKRHMEAAQKEAEEIELLNDVTETIEIPQPPAMPAYDAKMRHDIANIVHNPNFFEINGRSMDPAPLDVVYYDTPLPQEVPLPPDPVQPSTTAVAINFPPIDPPEDLPKRFADTYSHSPDAVQTCVAPWLTQKPTHDATDIPVTELFPSEAPRTVKDMLVWMAGLRHEKHKRTLKECIEKAFKRGDYDPSDLTLPVNDSSITADNLLHTIKLASVFAASALSAIAPEWRMAVPSATSTSKEPDCCALLCQLRDYVYVCYHQLAFLKSQCSRVQSEGGWQDCRYGHKVHNSPLQAFLTDTSKFKTHPFDPCDICRKSCVKMGFKAEDLPASQQTGKHISIILSPSCGGGLRLRTRLTTPLLHLQNRSLITFNRTLYKWIVKTTKDIEAAQKLVQKILDEVNGNANPNNKNELDEAIETVESNLENSVGDLKKWKDAADNVLEGTIVKSTQVHKELDPTQKDDDSGTTISKGIKKINDAKGKVSGVNTALQGIHTDLGKWKDAANIVLGTAVSKAEYVRGKLDPNKQDNGHVIGHKLSAISAANKGIQDANSQLDTQVSSLNSWINEAEKIRKAAEDKAREAYDKLKVNEALDKNVKLIVEAKDRINEVHNNLKSVHGSLGEWKIKAGEVLAGAIGSAEHVYEKLNPEKYGGAANDHLGKKIGDIEDNNNLIKEANQNLKNEVDNLGKWRDAAGSVISKADKKCEEILKRVDKDHKDYKGGKNGPVIYTQAEKLQNEGKRLLQAATDAKKAVESKVGDALNAVVEMDTSLKKDLKEVKDKIKLGMQNVIEQLEVNKLDQKVRDDLKSLKEKISELTKKVGDQVGDNNIVGKQLEALQVAKGGKLDGVVSGITNAEKELDGKFKSGISDPLNAKVRDVDSAIGALGGKFKDLKLEEQKTFGGIFGHIQSKVGEILNGEGGDKGLAGIAKGLVESYAGGFKIFNRIVTGWMEGTLGNDAEKAPKTWLGEYIEEKKNGGSQVNSKEAENRRNEILQVRDGIKKAIGSTFVIAIDQAGEKVNMSDNNIQTTIKSVKQACTYFVEQLDNELKKGIGTLSQTIFQKSTDSNAAAKSNLHLKVAVEATLLGLSATTSQVANEIESILLGTYRVGEKPHQTSIAQELDTVLGYANKLDGQLTAATTTNSFPPGQPESPARAVDSKLEAVRDEVTGLTATFTGSVTNNLTAAVSKLPQAVTAFNTVAQAQIKGAAKETIKAAADQIQMDSGGNIKLEENGQMSNFETAHKMIRNTDSGLQPQLQGKVEEHIGEDDTAVGTGGGAEKVKIEKGKFTHYEKHITQPLESGKTLEGKQDEGLLPEAIGSIKSVGLAELKIIEPVVGGRAEIEEKTFTGPFNTIKDQLDEIKKLVTHSGGDFIKGYKDDDKGVKNLLSDIRQMLNNGSWIEGKKGLDAIKTAIEKVQTGDLTTQPQQIDSAVTAIKAKLEELRGKLKGKHGSTEDVIHALGILKRDGLSNGDWHNGKNFWTPNGQPLSGLGKIQQGLQEQNEQLGNQNKIIGDAIDKIKWALACLGFKLQADLVGEKDWENGIKAKDNLHDIYEKIKQLQSGDFTNKPIEIENAKKVIVNELIALRNELQGSKLGEDVITTLNDLKTTGLGKEASWNPKGHNAKGLQNIENDLSTQQSELAKQPGAIGGGVDQITQSLESLRGTLENQVTDKLKKLKDHGLEKGDTPWTSDNQSLTGLTKITSDIVAIKDNDVDYVKRYVVTLRSAMRNADADIGSNLQMLEIERIDDGITERKVMAYTLTLKERMK